MITRDRLGTLLVLLLFLCHAASTTCAQSRDYQFLQGQDPLQDRNTYLLTVLESDPTARTVLAGRQDLRAIGRPLTEVRSAALTACLDSTVCRIDELTLSAVEIEQVANALGTLAKAGGPLASMVRDHLRPSGTILSSRTEVLPRATRRCSTAAETRSALVGTRSLISAIQRVDSLTQTLVRDPASGPIRPPMTNHLPRPHDKRKTAGGFDYLLKVRVRDMTAFRQFLRERIASRRGIQRRK